jgi:formate dehydrogenase major subunit
MRLNRREFIQISGAAAAGLALSSCAGKGGLFAPAEQAKALKIKDAKETTTICPYCAVGCGAIVHTAKRGDKRVINIDRVM